MGLTLKRKAKAEGMTMSRKGSIFATMLTSFVCQLLVTSVVQVEVGDAAKSEESTNAEWERLAIEYKLFGVGKAQTQKIMAEIFQERQKTLEALTNHFSRSLTLDWYTNDQLKVIQKTINITDKGKTLVFVPLYKPDLSIDKMKGPQLTPDKPYMIYHLMEQPIIVYYGGVSRRSAQHKMIASVLKKISEHTDLKFGETSFKRSASASLLFRFETTSSTDRCGLLNTTLTGLKRGYKTALVTINPQCQNDSHNLLKQTIHALGMQQEHTILNMNQNTRSYSEPVNTRSQMAGSEYDGMAHSYARFLNTIYTGSFNDCDFADYNPCHQNASCSMQSQEIDGTEISIPQCSCKSGNVGDGYELDSYEKHARNTDEFIDENYNKLFPREKRTGCAIDQCNVETDRKPDCDANEKCYFDYGDKVHTCISSDKSSNELLKDNVETDIRDAFCEMLEEAGMNDTSTEIDEELLTQSYLCDNYIGNNQSSVIKANEKRNEQIDTAIEYDMFGFIAQEGEVKGAAKTRIEMNKLISLRHKVEWKLDLYFNKKARKETQDDKDEYSLRKYTKDQLVAFDNSVPVISSLIVGTPQNNRVLTFKLIIEKENFRKNQVYRSTQGNQRRQKRDNQKIYRFPNKLMDSPIRWYVENASPQLVDEVQAIESAIFDITERTHLKFEKETNKHRATVIFRFKSFNYGCGSVDLNLYGSPARKRTVVIFISTNCKPHYKNPILHELGHALGMEHEHNAVGRDGYVFLRIPDRADFRITFQRIKPYYIYNHGSIMHYGIGYFVIKSPYNTSTVSVGGVNYNELSYTDAFYLNEAYFGVFDECQFKYYNPCSKNAICQDFKDKFAPPTCKCKDGYEGDGYNLTMYERHVRSNTVHYDLNWQTYFGHIKQTGCQRKKCTAEQQRVCDQFVNNECVSYSSVNYTCQCKHGYTRPTSASFGNCVQADPACPNCNTTAIDTLPSTFEVKDMLYYLWHEVARLKRNQQSMLANLDQSELI